MKPYYKVLRFFLIYLQLKVTPGSFCSRGPPSAGKQYCLCYINNNNED